MITHDIERPRPELPRIGLGCMGPSELYGPAARNESIATIHAALQADMSLLDTGDYCGSGHTELLIAEAPRGVAEKRSSSRGFGRRGTTSSP